MKTPPSWYSVLVALLMVGFLLVLTVGVFNLVLNELQDNNGRANYIKAYYGAESGIEWALLQVKDVGYGVVDEVPFGVNNRSIVLAKNPKVVSDFKRSRDVMITYNINTKTQTFSWELDVGEHQIIPLYYIEANGVQHDVKDLSLTMSGNPESIGWNLVGEKFWLSGIGNFIKDTQWDHKYIENLWGGGNVFKFSKKTVESFLSTSINNYLIIFNAHPTDTVRYNLTT